MKSWPTFSRKFTASPSSVAARRGGPRAVGPVAKELDQQADAHARRSLRDVCALALAPVGAGDVEVGPDAIARELAEEARGRTRPAAPPPSILPAVHAALA